MLEIVGLVEGFMPWVDTMFWLPIFGIAAPAAVALGGAALGGLSGLLSGGGSATTTQTGTSEGTSLLPPELQAQLALATQRANELEQLGISSGGTRLANQQLEGLLSGNISPQFQKLIQQIFQQTAAPVLSRASATGNFGGSDFNQLLGGISGDISTGLFQQALTAARQSPAERLGMLLAPVQAGAGQRVTTGATSGRTSVPIPKGNPITGALGGASLGLGLLGQFNQAQAAQ